tara:strand:- start:1296 stop:3713 length:2418 start_codon:yes stop_codon:yes gene_type:complete
MITFNNIVERFKVFADAHFFIKSFSFGSPDDVDLAKFTSFPLMHLVYTGATYDPGTKTYNLEVYILDVPADKTKKVDRQKEVVSDAEQCAEDIIADIKNGGNIFLFAQDYEVVNATTTPLEEETKNVLSGVLLDLSVSIPYEWDACNAPIDGVSPEGGDEVAYARRGILRMLTVDGATDVLSVRTIKVTNGTLTDNGDGVVTLDTGGGGAQSLDDLSDVDIVGTPSGGDVLSYNSGTTKFQLNGGLQELLANFKASGTGAQMFDTLNDTTKGNIDLQATTAAMKVNLTGISITESSPGVVDITVATDSAGSTEFTAIRITGTTTANVAETIIKSGNTFKFEDSSGDKIWLRVPNASGDITVLLPAITGTLALTSDISQDSAVQANTAKTSFPGFGTTAGTALEGDTSLLQLGTTSTTALAGDTTTISPAQADEITANTAKTSFPGFGTSAGTALEGDTALLQLGTSSTTALAGDTTTITTDQANEITANTAKNSYPSADATKLAGIETGADVTDATNVASAGALMASSAQLTGNLDTQANTITTTTTNGDIKLLPNGTGLVDIQGATNPGAIRLKCEDGSHGVTIQSPAHSAEANYTLTLPDNDGDANQVLQTDGSGNLSWVAQTGGSGGGMTETPLMTVTGRATFSSADDNESVVLGGSYGIGNYFQHTEELGDYDASAVIDSTTYSQTPYKHINTAIHLPSDSKKVRAKISYRIDDPETSQTWGFSMWSANNPSGTSSFDMTLRGRSTDTTPASTSSVYVYNKEFTTTSAITDDAIYFVIDHRTGSISSTTYVYFTLTLFLVD